MTVQDSTDVSGVAPPEPIPAPDIDDLIHNPDDLFWIRWPVLQPIRDWED